MSSFTVEKPERIIPSSGKTLQRWDTTEAISGTDLRSHTGKILSLTTCDMMEIAEMGHLKICVLTSLTAF